MPPFLINSAVDTLLKNEFDHYRKEKKPHPYFSLIGLKALPAQHPMLNQWRNVFKGVQYFIKKRNFLIFGGIDDLWISETGEFIVADYKATAKKDTPSLDGKYGKKYRNQIEFYQWLLRMNGENVSDNSYFVYCNGKKDKGKFNERVEFDIHMIEHKGDDSWVEETIHNAIDCLESSFVPESDIECEYCGFHEARNNFKIEEPTLF